MIEAGTKAPDFTLPSTEGTQVQLSSLQGTPVVLFFYPKDNTPGCTLEARGFRAYFESLSLHKTVILGISRDSTESHCEFQAKEQLPFSLLSDPSLEVHEAYDAWKEPLFGKGRKMHRCTYLIAPDGTIAKTYGKVNPLNHAAAVLRDIEHIGHKEGWFGDH